MLASSALLGLVGTAINAVLAAFAGTFASVFIAMAIAFPFLMVADGARYWEFARDRPKFSALLDSVWLIIQLGAYGVLVLLGGPGIVAVICTWALGAAAAATVFCLVRQSFPDVRALRTWISDHKGLSFRFFGEYLAISGVQQSVIYVSVLFAGLAAAGAVRGGQVIIGPLSVFSMGIAVVALPALSRRARRVSRKSFMQSAVVISGALLAITITYALLLLVLPASWGEFLLGDSWIAGAALVPVLLLQQAVNNVSYGATSGLRAMQAAKLSLRLRLATVPLVLACVIVGAYLDGAFGAILGAALGGSIQAICWWVAFFVAARALNSNNHTEDDSGDNKP